MEYGHPWVDGVAYTVSTAEGNQGLQSPKYGTAVNPGIVEGL
jgi:hypothetical protein